jgi:hypothetical protein
MMDFAITDIDFEGEARRFFSLQVNRYLSMRQRRCFSGMPEHDAVLDMIRDAWVELRSSGQLDGVGRRGRDTIYHTTIIVFPFFVADAGRNCVPVDFKNGRRLGGACFSKSAGTI